MSSGFWQRVRNPWVATGVCLTALVCVGLGLFVFQVIRSYRSIKSGQPDSLETARRKALVERVLSQPALSGIEKTLLASKVQDPVLGNPKGRIHIVEFLDYQCPFCAESAPALRAFMAKHAQEVSLTLRDYPIEELHPLAVQAAIAARCVFRQGNDAVFWRYHDLLFSNQEHASSIDLHDFAVRAGADGSAFDRCVAIKMPEADIRASLRDGSALQIQGTPTFFVNNHRLPGAIDLTTLEELYSQLTASSSSPL